MKTPGSANGTTVTLFTSGPFKVTMTCTDDGTNTSSEIDASSSEDQSDLNGEFADANTPTDTGADVPPTPDGTPGSLFAPTTIALVAPERRIGDRHRHGRRGKLRHRLLGRLHRSPLGRRRRDSASCG